MNHASAVDAFLPFEAFAGHERRFGICLLTVHIGTCLGVLRYRKAHLFVIAKVTARLSCTYKICDCLARRRRHSYTIASAVIQMSTVATFDSVRRFGRNDIAKTMCVGI